ncbi:23S rRNA (pseudouridine(1915)-N(3))-methyltransferase RlmH [Candidatus Peregrinibacteria bacterium]|jgi:23S rRNA (pseudouridine1915-N3)-methyltransferase|nr:23S rRNA (pseudouridine(1915)-N(3))-methyltransferase RlmH [Candidatus Peregrinibacteria bacterium]
MKITLLGIGKTKEIWIQQGIAEYLKRLSKFGKTECIFISESRKDNMKDIIENESQKIIEKIPKNSFCCLLDIHGEILSSEKLSKKIETWKNTAKGNHVVYIIGGAYGVSEKLKEIVDYRLSFSQMTFNHQMIRVFLLEQVYRAFCISSGHKYHK